MFLRKRSAAVAAQTGGQDLGLAGGYPPACSSLYRRVTASQRPVVSDSDLPSARPHTIRMHK